ncbi:MAG: gliding motility-associated C-terminal domain-containing protein [Bacteroidia bacterium]|nr:gliding motility-associated C-terminal domain-containing protein [Bacteroidia bacterium]
MKSFFALLFLSHCFWASAQSVSWSQDPFEQPVFTENAGQWNDLIPGQRVLFQTRNLGMDIYVTDKGIVYRHDRVVPLSSEEKEKRWKDSPSREFKMKNGHWSDFKLLPEFVRIEWKGAGAGVEAEGMEMQHHYHTFGAKEGNHYVSLKARTFKKVLLRNIYPGIDVECYLKENKQGLKYDFIVHPGADPGLIRIIYHNANKITALENGDRFVQTSLGSFTDHAPLVYYQDNRKLLSCTYSGTSEMIFSLEKFDPSRTLVIDPWISNPAFSGYNAGYDINYDNAGNVYVLGSYNPLQLARFDNTGALQWVYNMMGGYYAYGDFAVDENTGFSYIAEGKTGPTLMHKVDPAGALVLQNASTSTEMWRMEFNRVTNEFLIGGVGNTVEIMDVNLNFTPVNITAGVMNDNTLMCIDNCTNANDLYVAGNSGEMAKVPANTLAPTAWNGNNGYTFAYAGCRNVGGWIFPVMGYNGMAVSANWLYTFDGAVLKKWDKNTGAFITSVNVTGTPYQEGGLTTDRCNNVYAGANNQVNVYDPNLTLLTTIALPDTVYDLKLGLNNLLYATGKNFVAEIQLPPSLAVVLTLAQTPSSCTTCNGTASVTVSNSCLAASYLWSPGGQTTSSATGLCAGLYTVTVTNACGDTYSDTVTVQGPPLLSLSTSQQNVLCFGQNNGTATALPAGSSPFTYLWSNAQTGATATGLAGGTYTVTVTDANGCTLTATVTITQPASALSANPVVVSATCGNNNGSITGNAGGGTPGYIYQWSPSGGTNANASGLSAGTYTLTVTDANGCSVTATATVTTSSVPALTLSNVDVTCNGGNNGSATATATGNGPFTYAWLPSGGSNAAATGLSAGIYTCTVTDANGCTVSQTVSITQPAPMSVSASATLTTIGQGGASQLTVVGGITWLWNPAAGLSCTTCQSPVASPTVTTTYCVTATDAGGCTASACVTISVDVPCGTEILETLMPTAFSPNNDGRNDELCVPQNLCIESFNLKIYDRWGEKVFETENIADCWDGKYKGKELNTTAFVYHFVATLSNGEQFEQKGNITLVR